MIVSDDEGIAEQIKEDVEKIRSIPVSVWKKIENWGDETQELSNNQINVLHSIAYRVRTNTKVLDNERITGMKILDIVINKAPELLYEVID